MARCKRCALRPRVWPERRIFWGYLQFQFPAALTARDYLWDSRLWVSRSKKVEFFRSPLRCRTLRTFTGFYLLRRAESWEVGEICQWLRSRRSTGILTHFGSPFIISQSTLNEYFQFCLVELEDK